MPNDEWVGVADRVGINAGAEIVRGTWASAAQTGNMTGALIALESCITMVLASIVKTGGHEKVLDAVVVGAKARMAKFVLEGAKPHGHG